MRKSNSGSLKDIYDATKTMIRKHDKQCFSNIYFRDQVRVGLKSRTRSRGLLLRVFSFALDWPLEVEIIILMTIQELLS